MLKIDVHHIEPIRISQITYHFKTGNEKLYYIFSTIRLKKKKNNNSIEVSDAWTLFLVAVVAARCFTTKQINVSHVRDKESVAKRSLLFAYFVQKQINKTNS